MANEVPLSEARRRVALTVGVDAPWTPTDVRWFSHHWGIFRTELRQCRDLKEEIMGMELDATPPWVLALRGLRSGVGWWLTDAPFFARFGLGFTALFAYAFGWGWL